MNVKVLILLIFAPFPETGDYSAACEDEERAKQRAVDNRGHCRHRRLLVLSSTRYSMVGYHCFHHRKLGHSSTS